MIRKILLVLLICLLVLPLFPHMTVIDNITLAPKKVHGRDKSESEAYGKEFR